MTKEVILDRASAVVTYGSSASALFFGLDANTLYFLASIAVAVVAMLGNWVINWYFKAQHLKISQRMADQRPECATCPERET